ncbi:MAG: suppressor of fused domain protein [Oscillospiraceae bacterium]|nr:suppressor of fused domain protein [Oscillospiraceae bacterium]
MLNIAYKKVPEQILEKADTVCFYLNLAVRNKLPEYYVLDMFLDAFFTVGDKACRFEDELEQVDSYLFFNDVAHEIKASRDYFEFLRPDGLMPAEIFVELSLQTGEEIILVKMEGSTDEYDALLNFNAWFKEHGGTPASPGPRKQSRTARFIHKLTGYGEEEAFDPTAGAVRVEKTLRFCHACEGKKRGVDSCSQFIYEPEDISFRATRMVEAAYPGIGEPETFLNKELERINAEERIADEYRTDDCSYYHYLMREENKYDEASYDDYLSYVIDVYDVGGFWQIISRGLNYLADIDEENEMVYSVEYSMRLRKLPDKRADEREKMNAVSKMKELVIAAFMEERYYHDYEYISFQDPEPLDADKSSDKIGYIVVYDDILPVELDRAEFFSFLELIPITRPELEALESGEIDVETLYKKIGIGIRDYDRPSVI